MEVSQSAVLSYAGRRNLFDWLDTLAAIVLVVTLGGLLFLYTRSRP
jgi:hypothetical protein